MRFLFFLYAVRGPRAVARVTVISIPQTWLALKTFRAEAMPGKPYEQYQDFLIW